MLHEGVETAACEDDWPNLVTMFFRQADRFGERPLLWHKREGRYMPLTWREVAVQICMLARGLRSLGVVPGDRIVLLAENRPAWLVADFAIMAVGAITVPAYTTNTEADHLHILENSGASAVILSTRKLANQLLPAAMRCPHMRFVIAIDDLGLQQRPDFEVLQWREVMAFGERDHTNIRAIAAEIERTATRLHHLYLGHGRRTEGRDAASRRHPLQYCRRDRRSW